MCTPLVSIIIPTYNRSHLIGETLDSIIGQTYNCWECIIIDDESTDHTNLLLDFYSSKDSRIRYYSRPGIRLKGANSCRNYGLELSKGEYINWFDSDDIMDPEKIEKQVLILENEPCLDLSICQYSTYDENLNFLKHMEFEYTNLFYDYLSGKAYFNLQTTVFRRTSLKGFHFDENLFKAQELEFFTRFLNRQDVHFNFLHQCLVKIRLHENNISHSFKKGEIKAIISEMRVRGAILKILKKEENKSYYKSALEIYLKFLRTLLFLRKYFLYTKYSLILLLSIPSPFCSRIIRFYVKDMKIFFRNGNTFIK